MDFPCPYFGTDVRISAERRAHVLQGHPEFGTRMDRFLGDVLGRPHLVRRSRRVEKALLFSRWYTSLLGGKHVVVVVLGIESVPWIATAYVTRRLTAGVIEWQAD